MGKLGVWVLGLAVLAFCCLTATAATPAEVDKLIDKMANGKFKEREAAFKELEKIGVPALEALRKAAKSDDADLAQRAKDLIKAIEKKAEADELLKPTIVKLNYKDTPIQKVVEELSQQTGYPIRIQGDAKKLEAKKITIETREISLWEAIDILCSKAELTHVTQITAMQGGPGFPGGGGVDPSGAPPPPIDRDLPAKPGAPRPPVHPGVQWNPQEILLIDAKPEVYATAYCGAIRVRSVPAANFQGGIPLEKDEAMMAFEVVGEPKIMVLGVSVRLERAVDEKNQKVEPMAMGLPQGGDGATTEIILRNGNNVVIRGAKVAIAGNVNGQPLRLIAPAPGPYHGGQQIAVAKVKLPENAGKSLKELAGCLILQVQAQSKIIIDDLANAAGKTFQNKDGKEIKVVGVKKLENGQMQIQVEYDPNQQGGGIGPQPVPFPGGGIRIQPAIQLNFNMNDIPVEFCVAEAPGAAGGAAPGKAGKAVPPPQIEEVQPLPAVQPAPPVRPGRRPRPLPYYGPEQFQAFDKDGKPCAQAGDPVFAQRFDNATGKVTNSFMFTFQAPDKSEVAKFVFISPKATTIEVPFELKDVPMK